MIYFYNIVKEKVVLGIIIQIVRLIYLKVSLVLSKQINFFIQPRSNVIKDCGNSLCDVVYDRFKANLGKLICRFVEKIFEENRSINPSFIRSFVQRLICESSFHNKIEPFGTIESKRRLFFKQDQRFLNSLGIHANFLKLI